MATLPDDFRRRHLLPYTYRYPHRPPLRTTKLLAICSRSDDILCGPHSLCVALRYCRQGTQPSLNAVDLSRPLTTRISSALEFEL